MPRVLILGIFSQKDCVKGREVSRRHLPENMGVVFLNFNLLDFNHRGFLFFVFGRFMLTQF